MSGMLCQSIKCLDVVASSESDLSCGRSLVGLGLTAKTASAHPATSTSQPNAARDTKRTYSPCGQTLPAQRLSALVEYPEILRVLVEPAAPLAGDFADDAQAGKMIE